MTTQRDAAGEVTEASFEADPDEVDALERVIEEEHLGDDYPFLWTVGEAVDRREHRDPATGRIRGLYYWVSASESVAVCFQASDDFPDSWPAVAIHAPEGLKAGQLRRLSLSFTPYGRRKAGVGEPPDRQDIAGMWQARQRLEQRFGFIPRLRQLTPRDPDEETMTQFLRRFAPVYVELRGGVVSNVLGSLADQLGVSKPTVAYYVQEATRRGLIPAGLEEGARDE